MLVLTVTDRQVAALEVATRTTFVADTLEKLTQVLPEDIARLGHTAARSMIDAAAIRAKDAGIDSGRDYVRFCTLEILFGPEFERSAELPGILEILADRDLLAWDRVNRATAIGEAAMARRVGAR